VKRRCGCSLSLHKHLWEGKGREGGKKEGRKEGREIACANVGCRIILLCLGGNGLAMGE